MQLLDVAWDFCLLKVKFVFSLRRCISARKPLFNEEESSGKQNYAHSCDSAKFLEYKDSSNDKDKSTDEDPPIALNPLKYFIVRRLLSVLGGLVRLDNLSFSRKWRLLVPDRISSLSRSRGLICRGLRSRDRCESIRSRRCIYRIRCSMLTFLPPRKRAL